MSTPIQREKLSELRAELASQPTPIWAADYDQPVIRRGSQEKFHKPAPHSDEPAAVCDMLRARISPIHIHELEYVDGDAEPCAECWDVVEKRERAETVTCSLCGQEYNVSRGPQHLVEDCTAVGN